MSPETSMTSDRYALARIAWMAAVLLAAFLYSIGGHAQQPPDCSGYPEERVFLESQAWWWLSDKTTRVQTGDDFGHIHVGTCFPHAQPITGDIEFDVRLIMHDNPGMINDLVIQVWEDAPDLCWGGGGLACADFSASPLTCPPNETCVYWINLVVPVDVVTTDGRKEFRFRPIVSQPDGNMSFPSTGWQAYVTNGNPIVHYRNEDRIEARGWYTGADYQNSRIEVLPDEPVSGLWSPRVHMKPGAGGGPTTYHIAMIDPNFHSVPPSEGIVVQEGEGEFIGDLAIDTTQLTNGWHRLALRADFDLFDNPECVRASGALCDSTDSGLVVVWFEVDNVIRPDPPTEVRLMTQL